jgi:flotillin
MAKAAVADAERVEMERRAAVEAPAKAEKARVIVEAEAEAQKRRIEAEGEAAAIFLKLEAQAKGQYEILAKKGDGLRRIVEACGGSEDAYRMLMIEHLDAIAESSAKAISNIKFDKIVVWEGGGKDGTSSTAGFLHNLAKSMPPVLQVMKDIGGVEIPEYLVKLNPDAPSQPKAAESKPPEAKS